MPVRDGAVVWLCGAPGVGKSTVGWDLFARWSQQDLTVGYVDIDQLAMYQPASGGAAETTWLKASNLAAVLRRHRAAGASRIVVSGVAGPTEVPAFQQAVGAGGAIWVRLQAEPATLHARFLGRAMPAELVPEVDRHAAELAASTFAQLTLDTTRRTPHDLAAAIDRALADGSADTALTSGSADRAPTAGSAHRASTNRALEQVEPPDPDPSSAADPSSPDAKTASVILLTGPRAVGCSTVGWELFQRAQQHLPTAFVDLAQLGFVNHGLDLGVRRHDLRAAGLAALAVGYRRVGARLVVAVGAVTDADDLDRYRTALRRGALTVCRLRASPEELSRRVRARTTSTAGPYLAGDDLRGQDAVAADRVVRQSLREAAILDRSGVGDVLLDTTGASPADCARALWSRTRSR